MSHPSARAESRSTQLPWAAVLAVLVAFAAFYAAAGYRVLGLLALAVLASRLTPVRLPAQTWVRWVLRLVLTGIMVATAPSRAADLMNQSQTLGWIGQLCAIELAIGCWLPATRGLLAQQTALLSGIVFLAACDSTQSNAAWYVAPVYVACMVWALRDFDGGSLVATPARPRVAAPGWGWVFLTVALMLGGVACGGVAAARAVLGEWEARSRAQLSQLAGMCFSPTLGEGADLRSDMTRALRVEGPLRTSHLRAMAFHEYEGGSWFPLLDEREFVPAEVPEAPETVDHLRVTPLEPNGGVFFMPLEAAGVDPRENQQVEWDRGHGGPLRADSTVLGSYEVTVPAEKTTRPGLFAAPPASKYRLRCLTLPSDLNPKVRALASGVAKGRSQPGARVRAIEEYLRSSHAYSLTSAPAEGDPVTEFLLERKSGHCEYFAASSVLLMRCLGIPSRYVTGYYVHEREAPNVTLVRQRDSHAWAEAWIDGQGWITVDATPAAGRPDQLALPVPPWMRGWEWMQDQAVAARVAMSQFSGPQVFTALVAVVLGILLLARGWRWLRRGPGRDIVPSWSYIRPPADVAAVWERFERLLRLRGLCCPAGRTWQEYLTGLMAATDPEEAAVFPLDRDRVGQFLSGYNAARFGGNTTEAELDHLRALLRALEHGEAPRPVRWLELKFKVKPL